MFFLIVRNSIGASAPQMQAHYIDVGQGASALLEFPCGAVLIDTGAQDDDHVEHLASYLADFFRRRSDLNNTLATVFITHPHIDHTKGLPRVAATCRIQNYVDDGKVMGSGKNQVKWIRDQAESGQLMTRIREISDDEITALPNKKGLADDAIDPFMGAENAPNIVVLSGGMTTNPGWSSTQFKDLNNHSLVIRVDFGKSSFLFTGDLEIPAIQTLVDYYRNTHMLEVGVYHVGHHGSDNGTDRALLEAMRPSIAVMGVGQWDYGKGLRYPFTTYRYGHPRLSTMELLGEFISGTRVPMETMVFEASQEPSDYIVQKEIYATAWDGDVTITAGLDGDMNVTTQHANDLGNEHELTGNFHQDTTPNQLQIDRNTSVADSEPPYDSVAEIVPDKGSIQSPPPSSPIATVSSTAAPAMHDGRSNEWLPWVSVLAPYAWPFVVFVIALILRGKLVEILGGLGLRRVQAPGFTMEFERLVDRALDVSAKQTDEWAAPHVLPVEPRSDQLIANNLAAKLQLTPSPTNLSTAYYKELLSGDSRVAMALLMLDLELILRNVAIGYSVKVNPDMIIPELLESLLKNDAISKAQYELGFALFNICAAGIRQTGVSPVQASNILAITKGIFDAYTDWLVRYHRLSARQ
jgi:beta-lactamase superfamily II metal-dependent hydrolase